MPYTTRRDLLKIGAGILAASRRIPAAEQVSPLITAVSSYMSEAGSRKLPAPVIEKAKQMILDTFAAMISGSELPPGRFAINFARAYHGDGTCTVAGSNVVCGPHRSRSHQRHARSFRRDRRHASAVPIASRLFRRALGSGRGREVRHRRNPVSSAPWCWATISVRASP